MPHGFTFCAHGGCIQHAEMLWVQVLSPAHARKYWGTSLKKALEHTRVVNATALAGLLLRAWTVDMVDALNLTTPPSHCERGMTLRQVRCE